MGERRSAYRVLVGKPEEKRSLGRPRCGWGGMIILRWIFRKWDVGVWTGSTCLKIGIGFCKGGNEPSGFIKCGNFLTN